MEFTEQVFEDLDAAIATASPAERAGLVIQLAARLAQLGAGLVLPPAAAPPEENLEIAEVARRMKMSTRYVYRHARDWPFTKREGRRLLFNAHGLSRYLAGK